MKKLFIFNAILVAACALQAQQGDPMPVDPEQQFKEDTERMFKSFGFEFNFDGDHFTRDTVIIRQWGDTSLMPQFFNGNLEDFLGGDMRKLMEEFMQNPFRGFSDGGFEEFFQTNPFENGSGFFFDLKEFFPDSLLVLPPGEPLVPVEPKQKKKRKTYIL